MLRQWFLGVAIFFFDLCVLCFGVYFQFNVGFGCCVCSIVMFEVFEMEFVALCRVRSTFGGLLCFCIFVS